MYQVLSRISHRGLLLLGLSLASLIATAAPLTLEWVTTNVGVVTVGSQVSTNPQMITAIQSFSATLELRDDRLLTDGVFLSAHRFY
jgi:hypothetical protein